MGTRVPDDQRELFAAFRSVERGRARSTATGRLSEEECAPIGAREFSESDFKELRYASS